MKTFLPSGYSFSPDKLINNKNNKFIVENTHMSHLGGAIALIIVGLTFILLVAIFLSTVTNKANDIDSGTDALLKIGAEIFVMICSLLLLVLNSKLNRTVIKTYKTNAPFELPIKSNLRVHMLDKQHKPKSIKDHKQYPYKIYLDNSKKYSYYLQSERYFMTGQYKMSLNKKINIGMVQNNKFIPADNDLGAIFYKYHTYIMKHNLADKFSTKIIFKPDGQYLINNRYVQWIVTNDKDTVLHFDKNSHIVQSKINK